MRLGILALQGAVEKHQQTLNSIGVPEPILVKNPQDLQDLDALFLPGGESSTISKLLRFNGLDAPLKNELGRGLCVFATCAGLILLANEVEGATEDHCIFGVLDITVSRNAYGPQINSFEAELEISVLGQESFTGVFIRSPIISSVGDDVKILASYEMPDGNAHPALCQQGNILGASFHPELTSDTRLHEFFLNQIVHNS